MNISNFSSTQALLDAVTAFGKGYALTPPGETTALRSATSVRPDDVYRVRNVPVAFIIRRENGDRRESVTLERLDWATMGTFQRLLKRLLALVGKEVAPRYRLSAKEISDFRCALLQRPEEPAWLQCLEKAACSSEQGPGGRSSGVEALVNALHSTVSARLHDIEGQVAVLSVTDPDAAPVARTTMRELLTSDVYRFLLDRRLTAKQTDDAVRQLGLKRVRMLAPGLHGQGHPAVKLAASRLVELDCRLDQRPVPEPQLVSKREVAIGDLHGNGLLLLHTLVHAGFLRIEDGQKWDQACAQLNSLEGLNPDENWQGFARLLCDAVKPVAGTEKRKLVLLGDVFADRMHSDLFMLAILQVMAQNTLDFDCIFGNHDAEFLAACQSNATRPSNEDYCRRPGNRETMQSLSRTIEYLNAHPEDRDQFNQLVREIWLPRLKVCALSHDGTVFYSHAFANQDVLRGVEAMAGARHSATLAVRVADINRWFENSVATNKQTLDDLYANQTQRFKPVSPLQAMCNNVGLDNLAYDGKLAHRMNSAPTLADPSVAYCVHGHCEDIENRLAGLQADCDVQGLVRLQQSLDLHLRIEQEGRARVRQTLAGIGADANVDIIDFAARVVAFHLLHGRLPEETMSGLQQAFPAVTPTAIAGPPANAEAIAARVEKAWAAVAGPDAKPWLYRLSADQRARFLLTFWQFFSTAGKASSIERSTHIATKLAEAINKRRHLKAELDKVASEFVRQDRDKPKYDVRGKRESAVRTYRRLFAQRFHSLDSIHGSRPDHIGFPVRLHVL
ncbi:hypothetical protein [Cupriavidus sp. AU9028]|uniref:hypothetical protein n=1 Tax=Cupriavidus sp. AU9028 TaxID=2871157 RepID=UPI001C98C5F5|nr:hypothetical protein [Cupriavidus sp. AU9028]MBY4895984.1 hypothetical protein [Cupriavidus sp. AU9028]